jgi:hypothetical protein
MGMLDNVYAFNIPKPCDECMVVAMQGDLQYEDGRSAYVEDGAWLHHTVLYNGLGFTPGSKSDLVCSGTLLSGFLGWPHRIFASGNERTPVRLNTKYKFGIPIEKDMYFHMLYDLLNASEKPMKVYIAMTFEHVPRKEPGYREARMLWLDITGCGPSEAVPREGAYTARSPGWTSTIGGVMLATLGHTHDGGIYTTANVNGKVVCHSDQFYGTNPKFVEKNGVANLNNEAQMTMSSKGHNGGGHSQMPAAAPTMAAQGGPAHNQHGRMLPDQICTTEVSLTRYLDRNTESQPNAKLLEHITEVSSCVNFGILNVGDRIDVRATFNTSAHYQNRNMVTLTPDTFISLFFSS